MSEKVKMLTIKFTTTDGDASKIEQRVNNLFDLAEVVFNEDKNEGEIRIRSSVNILPEECFMRLDSLKSMEINEGFIGGQSGILSECENLEYVSFPDSFESVPEFACDHCPSLKEVKLGKHKEIGWAAFQCCESLNEIIIPDSVKNIQNNAFCGSGLESVKFSSNVAYIGESAFTGCDYLDEDSFDIPGDFDVDDILEGNEIGEEYYDDDDESYEGPDFEIKDGVLVRYHGNDSHVAIPEGVIDLGSNSFNQCCEIETVEIPSSVEYISPGAFFYAEKLKSVNIPDSVKAIGKRAFQGCESLSSIKLPDGIKVIREGTFGFSGLKSIVIPESVTRIEYEVFNNCENLESVTLPDHDSIEFYGTDIFKGCKNLEIENITAPAWEEDDIKSLFGDEDEYEDSYDEEESDDNDYEENESSDEYDEDLYEIENGVLIKYNGNEMFVTIPSCVNKIGTSAFCGNRSICTVIIPDSVTVIGNGAFCGCEYLTEVTIPDSVNVVGMAPFAGCTELEEYGVSCPDWMDKEKLLAGPDNWDYAMFNSYSA